MVILILGVSSVSLQVLLNHIKDYHCNILIWTMYNIYEILYLIAVCKPETANRV